MLLAMARKLAGWFWRLFGQGRAPTRFNVLYITLHIVFALFAIALVILMIATLARNKAA